MGEGRKKKYMNKGRKEDRKEGINKRRKDTKKEIRKEGRKEGRKGGGKEGRREGRKEVWQSSLKSYSSTTPFSFFSLLLYVLGKMSCHVSKIIESVHLR